VRGYLLDTSVLVTLGRLSDPRHTLVRRWVDKQPDAALCTCTIAVGEVARGVAALPDGLRRRREEPWLHHTMIPSFPILPFDLEASLRWGEFMGEGQRAGAVPTSDDGKIAAIAAVNGLTVATINPRDFGRIGVPFLDLTQP
jgi:predicted nucleic acid-binding protein